MAMTREEFFQRQAEAQVQIRRQCIPWGRIYAVWIGMIAGVFFSLACLFWSLYIQAGFFACAVWSGVIAICLLVIVVANGFYKRNVERYVRWNVGCHACHKSLVFPHRWEADEIEQNRCPHCNEAIFEEQLAV